MDGQVPMWNGHESFWAMASYPNPEPFLSLGDVLFLIALFGLYQAIRESFRRTLSPLQWIGLVTVTALIGWGVVFMVWGSYVAITLSAIPQLYLFCLTRPRKVDA
ncbi:hypothetical protein [Asaia bogorensis]|uniref:hypothetical protein n=1 Tax=Asaia bogorensis TaxID=91915 RepID=UPI000EFCA53F|nr:hypothetical protein [Asaia bogorensis]